MGLLLLFGHAAGGEPVNLLTNSSFEIEADGEPGPDGWHGDPAIFSVVEGDAWHGQAYLCCKAKGGHAGLWQALQGLEPETRLTLTVRMRRTDGKPVSGIRVLATDPTWHWSATTTKIEQDGAWELRRVTFTTPPQPMQFLRLRIHIYPEAAGETQIDGLSLRQGEDTGPYVTREDLREPQRRECADALARVPGGVFIDFGPQGQPVMPGFTPLKSNGAFSEATGHGWLPKATLEDVLRAARDGVVARPDPLCGDFVRLSGQATFRLTMPPGTYRLVVWMGDFARYSYEDHNYELLADGKRLFSEHVSRRAFWADWYLAGARNDLDPDTQSVFDHCVAPRFTQHDFSVQTQAGHIDIQWRAEGSVCVDGLALIPETSREAGRQAMAQVDGLRRLLFADATPAQIEPPASRPAGCLALGEGVSVWQRRLEQDQGEAIGSGGLGLTACAGEEETIALVVSSEAPLRQVEAEVGPLRPRRGQAINANACRAEWLLIRPVPTGQHTYDETPCTVKGDLLCPSPLSVVGPSRPRECWLTVRVPDDTLPGLYRGVVRLSTSGKALGEVPIGLRVREFRLQPLDYPCGAYYYPPSTYRNALGGLPVSDRGFLRLLEEEMRTARQMGFNMLSRFPWPRIEVVQGEVKLDYSWTDAYMEIVKKVGLEGAIPGYQGMTHMLSRQLASYAPEGSEEFAALVRRVIADVRDHGRQRGWPEVMVYIGDEFTADQAKSRFAGLARAAHGIQGVRTLCNGYWKAIPIIAPWLDIALAPAPPPAEAAEKLEGTGCVWALYNCGLNRFSLGFYTAAHPSPMRLEWHFLYTICDPHNYMDGASANEYHSMVLPGPERPYWRTHAFAIREGIDDYRYWLTLRTMLADAEGQGLPIPDQAARLLQQVTELGAESREGVRPRWTAARCARMRARIARAIEHLSNTP